MSNPLTQSIRPTGQFGDFTSLAAWESQNLDLVTLDSASYAMIDGNWSGSAADGAVTVAGWAIDVDHNITIECIGTGSRHSGIWNNSVHRLGYTSTMVTQTATTNEATYGFLDTVTVFWDRVIPAVEICDVSATIIS